MRRYRLVCPATACLLAFLAFPTSAQAPAVKRLSGTVASIAADVVTIAPAGGAPVEVKLAPDWSVSTLAPIKLADIVPGSFVGVGASGPDSHLVATQVVVFPEALRGAGEGHYPWVAHPGNSMTNANVEGTAVQADGRELTLSYKGGSVKALVPDGSPATAIGERRQIAADPGLPGAAYGDCRQ